MSSATIGLLLFTYIILSSSLSIGIIGGGMGGTATAYFLESLSSSDTEITLFEKSHMGGRSQTIEIDGLTIEYGGSVYHSANRLFVALAERFALENVSVAGEFDQYMGIFDGEEFAFVESEYDVVTAAKFLWRYGLSMFSVNEIANDIIEDWLKQYEKEFVFKRIEDFVEEMNFEKWVKYSVREILVDQHGLQDTFVDEVIAGVSRVTYNQNSSDMNGLGGLISVVGTGDDLFALKDGNFRLAENMLKASKAIFKNSHITHVHQRVNDGVTTYKVISESGEENTFDILVIASPLENNGITFHFELPKNALNIREYRRVHVTFVKGKFNPAYFSFENIDDIPTDILTTAHSTSPFTSIGTKKIYPDGSRLVKYFSINPLSEQDLDKIYQERSEVIRLEWDAYPILKPNPIYPPIELGEGLYYVNAFESLLSVMEGQIISGRNIARLINQKGFPQQHATQTTPNQKEDL